MASIQVAILARERRKVFGAVILSQGVAEPSSFDEDALLSSAPAAFYTYGIHERPTSKRS